MVELGKIEGTLFELEKAAVRIFYDISCAKKEYRLNGKINPIKEEVSQIADDAWALAAGLEEVVPDFEKMCDDVDRGDLFLMGARAARITSACDAALMYCEAFVSTAAELKEEIEKDVKNGAKLN